MKRKSLWLILLIFCFSIIVLPTQAQPSFQTDTATWTFMIYVAGDNDLEPFIINDLMEMQAVGSTDDVNIVVQVDRSPEYDAINGDWTDTRRFYVTQATDTVSYGDFEISVDNLINELSQFTPDVFEMSQDEFDSQLEVLRSGTRETAEATAFGIFGSPVSPNVPMVGIQQESIEDVGEINTGDPAYLVDFATWAIESFPAEHYGLILWDHGGGWIMLASDETDNGDALTLPEIAQALDEITASTGIEKLDLVAFDACLMAQLEVYQTIAPYALYAIASEETIPGAGWEYANALNALAQNPQMSVPEFGEQVIDAYINYYTDVLTGYPNFDLHVVDLAQVDQVTAALDSFTEAFQANPQESLTAIGNARNNAQIFGAGNTPDETDYFSSVDLADFMRLAQSLSPDANLQQAAQGVIDAISSMVLYGNSSGSPGANGVSIYFPFTDEAFSLGNNVEAYPQFTTEAMTGWISFLNTFHGNANATFAAADLSINITGVIPSDVPGSIYDPPVVEFESNGQGIVDMQFVAALQLDDGTQIIVDQDSLDFTYIDAEGQEINSYPEGISQNIFTWNAEMPVITDGTVSVPTVLLASSEDTNSATISGIYYWNDGQEATAYLVVDLETGQVTSVWGIESSQTGNAVSEIRPVPGDQFMPTWRYVDENGEYTLIPSESYLTFSTEPFSYEFVPADSGDYLLTLLVTDIAGNVSYDSAPLSVDNEGLDESLRGFKDTQFGINFLFPWDWNDPLLIEDEAGGATLEISDPEGNIHVYVSAYDVESVNELLDTALAQLDDFGADTGEPQAATLNGNDAYSVGYSYVDEDNAVRTGAMWVINVEENATGYIVDLDSADSTLDIAQDVFNIITESMTFFPPSV